MNLDLPEITVDFTIIDEDCYLNKHHPHMKCTRHYHKMTDREIKSCWRYLMRDFLDDYYAECLAKEEKTEDPSAEIRQKLEEVVKNAKERLKQKQQEQINLCNCQICKFENFCKYAGTDERLPVGTNESAQGLCPNLAC